MSNEIYKSFLEEYIVSSCTRKAIDTIFDKYYPYCNKIRYPEEWYEDKNNRLMGMPTGHLRYESGKMIWVKRNGK